MMLLTCYFAASILWMDIATEHPATIAVSNIVSIHPTQGYTDTYTTINSGYRSTVSVPTAYNEFIIQFQTCITKAK